MHAERRLGEQPRSKICVHVSVVCAIYQLTRNFKKEKKIKHELNHLEFESGVSYLRTMIL